MRNWRMNNRYRGKLVKQRYVIGKKFKRCAKIEVIGPPSMAFAVYHVFLEDGSDFTTGLLKDIEVKE